MLKFLQVGSPLSTQLKKVAQLKKKKSVTQLSNSTSSAFHVFPVFSHLHWLAWEDVTPAQSFRHTGIKPAAVSRVVYGQLSLKSSDQFKQAGLVYCRKNIACAFCNKKVCLLTVCNSRTKTAIKTLRRDCNLYACSTEQVSFREDSLKIIASK